MIYSITYHLHETYIHIQLYILRGTSDFLNRTGHFYQESSPGQVTDFFFMSPGGTHKN